MLLKQFPNIQWLKKQIRENFDDQKAAGGVALKYKGWPSVVLNTQTKQAERKDIKGPFSLFLNLKGSSLIGIEGKSLRVNDHCYAISNAGQHYDLLINEPSGTETFNIHFGEHFYRQSIHALCNGTEQLLDNPFDSSEKVHHLSPHSLPLTGASWLKLNQLVISYAGEEDPIEEEVQLFEVFSAVMNQRSEEIQRLSALPLKNRAVKEEIASRLCVSRDFLHAHFHENLSLDVLAEISCLSKFHFLRLFKSFFRQTPYQYQKLLRFEKAQALYKKGQTLEQIAPQIGMDNASSVSRLFRKQCGFYPSQFVYE